MNRLKSIQRILTLRCEEASELSSRELDEELTAPGSCGTLLPPPVVPLLPAVLQADSHHSAGTPISKSYLHEFQHERCPPLA